MKKNILKTGMHWVIVLGMLLPFSMNVGEVQAQATSDSETLEEITPENIQDLQLVRWVGEGAYTGDIAQQNDGNLIAAATTAGVKLLDKESGEQTGFVPIGLEPTALTISPDGSTLAVVVNLPTGELDGNARYVRQIQLYSLPDGEMLEAFQDLGECADSNIWAIAFTPDGAELIFEKKHGGQNTDRRFCALSLEGETEIRSIEVPQDAIMAISPNGEWAVSVSGEADTISLYDPQNFKVVEEIEVDAVETVGSTLLFSQDGQYIGLNSYSYDEDDEEYALQIWKLEDGSLVFSDNPSMIEDTARTFDVDASGENLYLGTQSGNVEAYSLASGKMTKQVGSSTWTIYSPIANPGGIPAAEQSSSIQNVMLSQDGESLIVSDSLTSYGQSIHIRVFATPELAESFDFSGPAVGSDDPAIAFSPDSSQIALVGESDGKVEIYNTQDGKLTMTLDGHTQVANQVSFAPDGKMIATGSNDNTIRLWDAQSGELLHTLEGHQARVNRLAFSPDSTWLVSGADDNTLRRWNTADGNLLETLELGDEHWRVEFLDILTDNTSVVYRITKYPSPYIGYINKQMIWNTQSGDSKTIGGSDIYLTRLSEENDLFMGYSIGNSSGWLVGTFQGDGSMRIISTFKSPHGNGALSHGVVISPNKRLVISGNGFGLHAWELKENALNFLGLVATQEAIPSYGNEYIFSPDGKYLAFTNGDGIAYLLGVTAP